MCVSVIPSWFSAILCLPCICAYSKSVEVKIDNKRITQKYDAICMSSERTVPLDRIQDVNVSRDCCNKLTGTSSISIQTAGGGPQGAAEIKLFAPLNCQMVRDQIIFARDNAVQYGGHDGMGGASSTNVTTPLLGNTNDINTMKESILRIEKLVQVGVTKI